MPDDAQNGINASMLVNQMVEEGLITKEDVKAEIHCMEPKFLEH